MRFQKTRQGWRRGAGLGRGGPGAGTRLGAGAVGHGGSWPPAPCPQTPPRAAGQGSAMARARLRVCPALTAPQVADLLPTAPAGLIPPSHGCPCPRAPARAWRGTRVGGGRATRGTHHRPCRSPPDAQPWGQKTGLPGAERGGRRHTGSAERLKKKRKDLSPRSFSNVSH